MADYDGTLKLLLRKSANVAIREVVGVPIEHWLDAELPNPRSLRLDLLGEAADRTLVHIELQSTNDRRMAFRMAEYALAIYRVYGRFPQQFCLYVGDARIRMARVLQGPGFSAEYTLIDARTIDGDELLESPAIGDNLIAILTRLRDDKDAIRRILTRIGGLPKGVREEALFQLYELAGLRRMAPLVTQEVEAMPVYIDLRKNEVLGPPYKRGLRDGRKQGRREGEMSILRLLIEKRFGALPDWAEERLASKTAAELREMSVRVLDASGIEDLLK
jgi:predicted transposase YdaD